MTWCDFLETEIDEACEHGNCPKCCLPCSRAELKEIAAKYLGRES